MRRQDTVTIRVDRKTKAALDMIVAEHYVVTGKTMTHTEAIWYVVQNAEQDIAERIEQLASNQAKKE